MMPAKNAAGKAGTGVFFPIALQESLSTTNGSPAPALPSAPDTSGCVPVPGSAHDGMFQHAPTGVCADKRVNDGDCTAVKPGRAAATCGDPADVATVNALSNGPRTSPGVDTSHHRQQAAPRGRRDLKIAERNQHRPPYGRFSSDFPTTTCTAALQSRLLQQAVLPSRDATWPENAFCSSLSAPSSPSTRAAAGAGGIDKLSFQRGVFGTNTDCPSLQSLLLAHPHATPLAPAHSQNIPLPQHAWQQQECRWPGSQAEHAAYRPNEPTPLGRLAAGLVPLSATADSCSSTPFMSQHLPTNSTNGSWLLPHLAAVPAAATLTDTSCRRRASFGPVTSCTALLRDSLDSRTYSVPLPDTYNPHQPSAEICAALSAAGLTFECDQSETAAAAGEDALAAEVDAALYQLLVMRSQMASKKQAQVAIAAPTSDAAPSALFPANISPPALGIGAGSVSPSCTLAPPVYTQGLGLHCVQNSTNTNTAAGIQSGSHIQSMGANVCVPKACQPMFLSDAAPAVHRDQHPLNMDTMFASLMIDAPLRSALGACVPPYTCSGEEPLQREMTLADVLANAAAGRMQVPAMTPADELQLLAREQLAVAAAAADLGIPGMAVSTFDMSAHNVFLQ